MKTKIYTCLLAMALSAEPPKCQIEINRAYRELEVHGGHDYRSDAQTNSNPQPGLVIFTLTLTSVRGPSANPKTFTPIRVE